ncbi:RNA-binding protein RO60-like [Prorops nasuta]|uniref:RNA-binding protein RO60-like n=1 Tax=Prorops nasuta TaxID=863751 RepID=UPI0034CF7845
MAAEDATNADANANSPEVRLMQFLFVGKEYPEYQPGDWFVHKYFLVKNVPSIEELAEDTDVKKQLLPIELINKAYNSKLVQNPETLVFALAVCARQDKSQALRQAAYKAVQTICKSTQHFLLFIKFAHQLSNQKDLMSADAEKSNGWGHGLRTTVNNWYLSKEPLELVKCVTRYKSRYGWKHKDIIKLCHTNPTSPEMEVITAYIIFGIKEAQKNFKDKPNTEQILKYIQDVEDFKHCEDEITCARLLEVNDFSLDHVPGNMLKSEEVWNALIPTLDIATLLNNLQRIHNLGLLKPNAPSVEKLIDQISNEQKLQTDKVHPALVLLTIKNYENSGKPLSYEKRKIKEQAKKPLPPPPAPNSKIIDALYKTLNSTFAYLEPTNLRYMITINTNKIMLESRAWRNGNLNGLEAGCIIALSLLRSEENVTIATFDNAGVHIANIEKTLSFPQTMRKLQQATPGTVKLNEPMVWASQQNNRYDVFINVVDQINEKNDKSEKVVAAYRTSMKLPQAKLINCVVCSPTTYHKKKIDKSNLIICGFDANVPTIITAFAKSLF